MRLVIQRVSSASVTIDQQTISSIKSGLLVLVGIASQDTQADMQWLINKLLTLKVFEDDSSRLKLSVVDIQGELLVVSQFTLYGDVRKGTTPSWSNAAPPQIAEPLYDQFITLLKRSTSLNVDTGKFGATMQVDLVNDGPLTLIIDSPAI